MPAGRNLFPFMHRGIGIHRSTRVLRSRAISLGELETPQNKKTPAHLRMSEGAVVLAAREQP